MLSAGRYRDRSLVDTTLEGILPRASFMGRLSPGAGAHDQIRAAFERYALVGEVRACHGIGHVRDSLGV